MIDAVAINPERLLRENVVAPPPFGKNVSWGAILAGVVIALVAQLAFAILGLGIGLSTVDPASTGMPSAFGLTTSAAVWWLASGTIAAALGGFVAGRLSGRLSASVTGYHGLVSWGVTTIVIMVLLSSAVGGVLGGAFNAVTSTLGGTGRILGGAVQTAAQTAAPSLPTLNDPLSSIDAQIRSASGGQDPAQLRDVAIQAIRAAVAGDTAQQRDALDRAADALAKAQNIAPEQAKAQVQLYRQQYADALSVAKTKATKLADAAARTTSQASLMIVLALAFGAIAATIGGRLAHRASRLQSSD